MALRRIRSREAETESVNLRMLRRGSVKRIHIGEKMGSEELGDGIVLPRHLGQHAIREQNVDPRIIARVERVIDLGDSTVRTGFSRGHVILRTCSMIRLGAVLAVSGDTDMVASITRNGSAVRSVTVPDGVSSHYVELPGLDFAVGDVWQMNVTTVGDGAAGLSWHGQFA